ncbi:protein-tyrosine phosphatase-like protein [Rhodocollybia butyracea]|uniref:protein-tyrosine-phosphatase n=1 Tax=Rhodocollybia butyracea TaxID=206335 RepID=A0A9P5PW03_9AGAR|nr:protein-tyrosine phosphatase-like protein [Rhodocollybia butyracea]
MIPPSVDEVDKQIYLGNLSAAFSSDLRNQLGITHILSVCPETLSSVDSEGFKCQNIVVDDCEYADLLIHLPKACQFIQQAIDEEGRILIHCVMGVSRSATVLAAFFMQSKNISPSEAIGLIRTRRSCIQPNYGFKLQLDAFAQCNYHPSADNPAYISWKRRQEQDVTFFLNQMIDTTSVIRNQFDFPNEIESAESLIVELGITHLLSIAPSTAIPNVPHVQHHHISDAQQDHGVLLLAIPETNNYIKEALATNGVVLVFSSLESKAVLAAYGYFMCSQKSSPKQVYQQLTEVLPLFHHTSNFTEQLELLDACAGVPTPDHPLVSKWLSKLESGGTSGWSSRRGSSTEAMATALNKTAMNLLSETGLDLSTFSETLNKSLSRCTYVGDSLYTRMERMADDLPPR